MDPTTKQADILGKDLQPEMVSLRVQHLRILEFQAIQM
jgi:hypothetical protein